MATINLSVTTVNDQNDGNASNGLSLREAILNANANPNDNYIIQLQGGQNYSLNIGGEAEDNGTLGDLDISGNIAIDVTGTGLATINGDGNENVFHVLENGTLNLTNIRVTAGQSRFGAGIYTNENSSVTLKNTIISGNNSTDDGGGIFNNGNLTLLENTLISNNAADYGGGIFNQGRLVMSNTVITNNVARNSGGGAYNNNIIDVNNSIFDSNSGIGLTNGSNANVHNTTFKGNDGGAISNFSSLNITNSTFFQNTASRGAGIQNNRGTSNIVNSTFTQNSALDDGGAIYHNDGITNLNNVTITNNTANSDNSGGGGGDGGGISSSGGVNLKNSIVAGNFDTPSNSGRGPVYPDIVGIVSGDGSNIIGSIAGATGSVGTGSDRVGINPRLGGLADNGGPTQTIALLAGSPAIDAGDNSLLPSDPNDLDGDGNISVISVDQRGLSRTFNGTTDIGAYESQGTVVSSVNTPIFRLQSNIRPGTYLFTGESEAQGILSNPNTSSQFVNEGFAFNVGIEAGDDLIGLYRFQNKTVSGTYLYVGEEERNAIVNNPNLSQTFELEGLAFYVYGAGSGNGEPLYRLQNNAIPGTYLFAGQQERDAIFANPSFAANFNDEGIAFEVSTF